MPAFHLPLLARRRGLLLAVSAVALLSGSATAQPASVAPLQIAPRTQPAQPGESVAPDTILKRLPAGPEELTFRGEMASRSFTVPLGRSEAARISTLQVAILNTVSLLPERSALKIAVNGRPLVSLPANAADKPAIVPVAIPPGLLVPGANTVEVSASLAHRVDCSVAATYELWAALDPSSTGFLIPRDAAPPFSKLEDLALLPVGQDGATHIHVRLAADAAGEDVTAAARAVQALVRRAGLVRPVVDVGPDVGTGAGLDVVPAADGGQHSGSAVSLGDIAITRDGASGRVIATVDPGAASGRSSAVSDPAGQTVVTGETRQTFAALGHPTEVFTGRRYLSRLTLTLPPDFMATNDRVRLLLDGGHGGSLVDGDTLAVRVDGTLVSSVPLAAGKAERFNHREVELPLKFFHPGSNNIAIEATTSATADAQCNTVTMPRDARLTINGTSELVVPAFARLTMIPQIPAALTVRDALPVYLPAGDPATVGTALTVLANLATTADSLPTPEVHAGMPSDGDAPGLVVAAAESLPAALTAHLRTLTSQVSATDDHASSADANADSTASPAGEAQWQVGTAATAVRSFLRARGFFYGMAAAAPLRLKPDSMIVAAVTPDGMDPDGLRSALPRFVRSADHWLVVTAANDQALQNGTTRLVANGRWAALKGEAVAYDPGTDALQIRQPRNVTYVVPSRLVLTDMKPILGGLLSDNITLSLSVMVLLLGLLGASTHALIRRSGVR